MNVATDKINNLLESFMGINDTELGKLQNTANLILLIDRVKCCINKDNV